MGSCGGSSGTWRPAFKVMGLGGSKDQGGRREESHQCVAVELQVVSWPGLRTGRMRGLDGRASCCGMEVMAVLCIVEEEEG